jgi:GT2 family glycosyltransferase/glycosyltransferase involved in cell wall biosynthesis
MSRELPVDIIIPIYNAYEDLVRCIDSIRKWTDLEQNRLILINDCSPDERIRPYLDALSSEHIVVIHNENNVGFSGNINTGMAQSDGNDVLLLNSDTVVTKGWIEKIKACAYSDVTIATVTPLSNNATLCSVPVFLGENQIPEGYDVDSYADLIERASLKRYPSIPVAHGFCMYVKREVIDKIGNFDAATFGRGYGEENDFCYRAEQVGYRHAMCDDTFILHTGTSSFQSEEKRKYIEEHDKILNERYPEQNHNVAVHCRDNPNHFVADNINLRMALEQSEDRKNILYLVQSDFREDADDNIGGTQLHVKDLAMGLKHLFNVFVAARDRNYLNLTMYRDEKEYFFRFYIGSAKRYTSFRDKEMGELFGRILDNFHIHLVHIHHMIGLSLEMYYQAYERKIPMITTLHDFYSVCPTIKLLDADGHYCVGHTTEDKCKACISKNCSTAEQIPYLKVWRQEWQKALEMVQMIVVPSEAAKNIISGFYPNVSSKINVIYHGSDSMRKPSVNHQHKGFHVAFLGGISSEKGSYVCSQMIRHGSKDIRWHLFGIFGRDDVPASGNFIKAGRYRREELPDLMEKYEIDLVCILPIWPETFCYTLSEAVMCGVPVLTTDIGALQERMNLLNCGWTVPYQSTADDVLKLIERIKDKGEEYQEKLQNVQTAQIRSVNEMCKEYGELYGQYLFAHNRVERYTDDREWILNAYLLAEGPCGFLRGSEENLYQKLDDMEREIREIRNSTAFKIASGIGRKNLPLKKQIKAVIYFANRLRK